MNLISKNNQQYCKYYDNFKDKSKGGKFKIKMKDNIFDIEEIKTACRKKKICGFHYVKRYESADIVFMPYNYAFDQRYRDTHPNMIKDSIIIFDEAHNVLDGAEEGSSFSISLSQLQTALNQLMKL